MKWNQIKVEMEMPDAQDPAAAAIDAAKRHHVLTWEALEEGDELSQWVLESFVAEGRTPLPDGAYLMRGGTNTSYMTVPTGAEVRDLFQDAQSYQKFLVSMALRGWATGAVESCTTDLMTDGSKSVRVETLKEQEETALTVRPILRRDSLELETRRFPGCA